MDNQSYPPPTLFNVGVRFRIHAPGITSAVGRVRKLLKLLPYVNTARGETMEVAPDVPCARTALTDRELATVLAALRHFQGYRGYDAESDAGLNSMEHFAVHAALDGDEIDALYDRLNTTEVVGV